MATETDDDNDVLPEDLAHMEDCTCDHEPEQHGWGNCEVEGCNCEGGWTE
jgi:hypothetical protein